MGKSFRFVGVISLTYHWQRAYCYGMYMGFISQLIYEFELIPQLLETLATQIQFSQDFTSRFPEIVVPPVIHFEYDFPWNKPTSSWGTPMASWNSFHNNDLPCSPHLSAAPARLQAVRRPRGVGRPWDFPAMKSGDLLDMAYIISPISRHIYGICRGYMEKYPEFLI